MTGLHRAVVLRKATAFKGSVILLDQQLGKIEGRIADHRAGKGQQLFHGALISCSLKKWRMSYNISHSMLVDMPLYWVGEHFLFFHHVLELCTSFLSFDEQASEVFSLIEKLYTDPVSVGTKEAKKLFLCQFFKLIGMYSEHEQEDRGAWLRACIREHPKASSFNTVKFLDTLDRHEETA